MAPTSSTPPEDKSERLAELAKVLETALAKQGASARAIAERAGIGASHLSKVLKAKRSLKRAKLIVLADLLGIDRDKVLRLAGFGRSEASRLDLGRVTLLRSLDRFTLNVVVTPRFYDSAVLMWLFRHQPLSEVGVETQLRRAEWGNVPAELASYTFSVGFHDRTPATYRLARWSHLALYKGHAVVGRSGSIESGRTRLPAIADQLRKKGRRPVLISIDHDMIDLLRESAAFGDEFDVQIIPNPDVALESFQNGAGDLFFGGLPQRLALRRSGFEELVTYGKDFPQLYSLNSLICSERMVEEKRPLLQAIDALWYETCRRLYADAAFRAQAFQEILELLEKHGIEKHSLTKDGFDLLFSPAGSEFEMFAQFPAQIGEELKRVRG